VHSALKMAEDGEAFDTVAAADACNFSLVEVKEREEVNCLPV